MKRIILILLALAVLAPFAAVAEETYYKPGNLVLTLGVGAGLGFNGFTLTAYPGVELVFAKVRIADAVPLDFGIATRGLFGVAFDPSYINLGVGVFPTVHLGFRAMENAADWLDPFDLWLGIGVAYYAHVAYGGTTAPWVGPPINPVVVVGVNYFINDRFALTFTGGYWGEGSGAVGLLIRLGRNPQPRVTVG